MIKPDDKFKIETKEESKSEESESRQGSSINVPLKPQNITASVNPNPPEKHICRLAKLKRHAVDFYTDSYSVNQAVVRGKTYEAIVLKFVVYRDKDSSANK